MNVFFFLLPLLGDERSEIPCCLCWSRNDAWVMSAQERRGLIDVPKYDLLVNVSIVGGVGGGYLLLWWVVDRSWCCGNGGEDDQWGLLAFVVGR